MGKSQGKKLKEALKAQGLIGTGPQKKNARKDRDRAVQAIRDSFNAFEIKQNRQKLVVSGGRNLQGTSGRPGLTKQLNEEARMRSRQRELATKNKAGALVDRRFGERDKSLTAEEKMLQRFTREQQRKAKTSIFDLQDLDEDDDAVLTHFGQTLDMKDDFEAEDDLEDPDDEDKRPAKRRLIDGTEEELEEEENTRPKTKAEVMREVIAKSKFYKQERQAAKRADDQVIDELNQQENMQELFQELQGVSGGPKVAEIGEDDYDKQVRELAFDRRAQPADRTKTDEEIEAEEKAKHEMLERQRLARMEGDDLGDELENEVEEEEDEEGLGDARQFGFARLDEDDVEDEDEDEDEEDEDEKDADGGADEDDDEDEDEVKKVKQTPKLGLPKNTLQLQDLFNKHGAQKALKKLLSAYDPAKAQGNKQRIGRLCSVMVEHLVRYSWSASEAQAFEHTLTVLKEKFEPYTEDLSTQIRQMLVDMHEQLQLRLDGHDKAFPGPEHVRLLFVISTIYSTSDSHHWVATLAMLLMGQHLSQVPVQTYSDAFYGLATCSVWLRYVHQSRRFVPEIVHFLHSALSFLAEATAGLKLDFKGSVRDLSLSSDTKPSKSTYTLLYQNLAVFLGELASVWRDQSAFPEIFEPLLSRIELALGPENAAAEALDKVGRLLKFSGQDRRPLQLQAHKPIPLASYAPKFEENFSLDKKSYDADPQRRETAKLRAEFKKERKGLLRDIRRDNAFTSREKNRDRRQQDAQYHAKLARIERTVATEEGREKNEYERDKRARKARK